jgi:hypothetical protein
MSRLAVQAVAPCRPDRDLFTNSFNGGTYANPKGGGEPFGTLRVDGGLDTPCKNAGLLDRLEYYGVRVWA